MAEDLNLEETEDFEVVELESEEGNIEEFVIVGRVEIKGSQYAVMGLLEDMQNMENMSEEEFAEFYGDDDLFIIMKQDGEIFVELDDEEFDSIKDELSNKIEALGL